MNTTTTLWYGILTWKNQSDMMLSRVKINVIQWVLVFPLAITLVCVIGTARAGIANAPLFVTSQVAPNVFFMLDDSGSMDWTILSKKYWEPCAYDPDSGTDVDESNDCGNIVENGEMRSYGTR